MEFALGNMHITSYALNQWVDSSKTKPGPLPDFVSKRFFWGVTGPCSFVYVQSMAIFIVTTTE